MTKKQFETVMKYGEARGTKYVYRLKPTERGTLKIIRVPLWAVEARLLYIPETVVVWEGVVPYGW